MVNVQTLKPGSFDVVCDDIHTSHLWTHQWAVCIDDAGEQGVGFYFPCKPTRKQRRKCIKVAKDIML